VLLEAQIPSLCNRRYAVFPLDQFFNIWFIIIVRTEMNISEPTNLSYRAHSKKLIEHLRRSRTTNLIVWFADLDLVVLGLRSYGLVV
jgi:hypothetical protein